jgi:UDP-N-acetylmuramate dehydrogenase
MKAQLDVSIFGKCRELIRTDEFLSRHTSFQIGGPAQFLAEPENIVQAWHLADKARELGMPFHVLGGGTNLLVDDAGVPGLVIKISRLRWRFLKGGLLHVGAGTRLSSLVNYACTQAISGFERFAGIPGLVGGMIRTNTGGRYGALSDVIHSARLLNRDCTITTRMAADFGFGYRTSNLKDEIALELVFHVQKRDLQELLIECKRILDEKRAAQPLGECCAGCIFRNPEGARAWALIGECGLQGTRVGGAVVSTKHANFICNDRGATASDVLALIERVKDSVRRQTGYELELEVIRWPCLPDA